MLQKIGEFSTSTNYGGVTKQVTGIGCGPIIGGIVTRTPPQMFGLTNEQLEAAEAWIQKHSEELRDLI